MVAPLELSRSRSYPLAVEDAFDRLLPMPLELVFARRFGPIPAVRNTEGPQPWGAAGQARIVRLADGGCMREELTEVDRPHSFSYTLTEVRGPMKPLAPRSAASGRSPR